VKGIDLAIRVVSALGDGYRLVVVGDGAERPNLEALVAELGVTDRVELRGWDDRARHVLGTFDVYLLPSRLEGFPITVMEAMQAGVPVVATEVGSIREAIEDGETGFVVPVGDVNAMAAAVRLLSEDPELRARMGEQAQDLLTGEHGDGGDRFQGGRWSNQGGGWQGGGDGHGHLEDKGRALSGATSRADARAVCNPWDPL
jgi:glycosyltransferase involved in cell wall biosynthesis